MEKYVFLADLLNKFSQLTPWVQATDRCEVCGGDVEHGLGDTEKLRVREK